MSLHQQALRNKMASPDAQADQSAGGSADTVVNEQEKRIQSLYGGLPKKKTVLNRGPTNQRKYFDSGDYAMAKAGKTSEQEVGTTVPSPAMIPHVNSPSVVSQTLSSSPNASPVAVAVSDVTGPNNPGVADLARSPPSNDMLPPSAANDTNDEGVPAHTKPVERETAKEDMLNQLEKPTS